MDINESYKILDVNSTSTYEEITKSYKKLALQFHPDKNRENKKLANENMAKLNIAYSNITSNNFKTEKEKSPDPNNQDWQKKHYKTYSEEMYENRTEDDKELLINKFVKIKEFTKDFLYQYFQYNLYNFPKRESPANRIKFQKTVENLKISYHAVRNLSLKTKDYELLSHFNTFSKMIFDFYKSSECVDIIDSYKNSTEVYAFRIYKSGNKSLYLAEKELFYDRHNKGKINTKKIIPNLIQAEQSFKNVLNSFSSSSWSVESGIKLEYTLSLKDYYNLFFSK